MSNNEILKENKRKIIEKQKILKILRKVITSQLELVLLQGKY